MPTAFRAPQRRQLTADEEADRSLVGVFVVVRSGFMEFDSGKSKRGEDRGDEDEEGPPSLPLQRRWPRRCLLTVYPRRLLQIGDFSLPQTETATVPISR